eukprot:6190362-Pleurochrysis_carterae.AAC.1
MLPTLFTYPAYLTCLPTLAALAFVRWASLRQQTLYRTVAGMMKNEKALELLLRAQLPQARTGGSRAAVIPRCLFE